VKLAEIDGKQLITVNPTDSVNHAFTLMVDHDIRHLPIVEGDRVVGIVSDRDLLIIANWIATWKSLTHATTAVGKKRVAELMSSPVSVLSRDDTVEHAAQLMLERRFSAVPLLQAGRLASIVTETDILRCFLDGATKYVSCPWRGFRVGDHMARTVVTGKPSDHVMPSFHLMKEKHIRHLPIIDGGKLVGLISERDLRRTYGKEIAANLARDEPSLELAIHYSLRDAMSRNVETISEEATLAEAAARMVKGKIGALPVTDQDNLLGIITETDLLKVFVEHGEK